jgi:dihydropyrimidinase
MTEKFDLVFKGGILVNGSGIRRADVAVRAEKIALLADDIPAAGAGRVIDARGKYLLPGVIDAHVHPVYEDDVEGSSRVAAHGGTTMLIHFVYAKKGESLYDMTRKMQDDGRARSRLDFSLHSAPFDAPNQVGEIEKVMLLGVKSFKFFMSYVKLGWNTDDYQLARAMDILAANGGLAMVHAENGGAIDYLEDKYLTGPKASWKYFTTAHPAALEEEAIFRAITIAEVTGCPLYIPHNTAARSLIPIRRARAEGRVVYGETCPQYLCLTEDILGQRGALAKIGPPIRTAADGAALWAGLADNSLQTIASDHAPKKKDPAGDFLKQPYGSPGVENVLTITHHEGVNSGRLSLVRMVQVLSENPARIFGLYPKKGLIAAGSDADIVVFDPARSMTISAANQHSGAGYSLFEGRSLLGWPEATFQRGRPVLENGQIVAAPGQGQFVPTAPKGEFL